jgi:outer membrane protein OmpA-like peptidoglycan-associated protein
MRRLTLCAAVGALVAASGTAAAAPTCGPDPYRGPTGYSPTSFGPAARPPMPAPPPFAAAPPMPHFGEYPRPYPGGYELPAMPPMPEPPPLPRPPLPPVYGQHPGYGGFPGHFGPLVAPGFGPLTMPGHGPWWMAPPTARPAPESASNPDADADGIPLPADLCSNTPAGTEVDQTGCAVAAPIRLEGVNFHTDSADLTDQSLAILDRVAATLAANPDIKVEVAGHTDNQGDADYNVDLSQRRTETVMAYLTAHGVAAESLTARGYGQTQPVADNATAEGRARNRRVELRRLDQ